MNQQKKELEPQDNIAAILSTAYDNVIEAWRDVNQKINQAKSTEKYKHQLGLLTEMRDELESMKIQLKNLDFNTPKGQAQALSLTARFVEKFDNAENKALMGNENWFSALLKILKALFSKTKKEASFDHANKTVSKIYSSTQRTFWSRVSGESAKDKTLRRYYDSAVHAMETLIELIPETNNALRQKTYSYLNDLLSLAANFSRDHIPCGLFSKLLKNFAAEAKHYTTDTALKSIFQQTSCAFEGTSSWLDSQAPVKRNASEQEKYKSLKKIFMEGLLEHECPSYVQKAMDQGDERAAFEMGHFQSNMLKIVLDFYETGSVDEFLYLVKQEFKKLENKEAFLGKGAGKEFLALAMGIFSQPDDASSLTCAH